jgi:hypothetical protein
MRRDARDALIREAAVAVVSVSLFSQQEAVAESYTYQCTFSVMFAAVLLL